MSPAYSQDIIEFVTVSAQTCLLLEQANQQERDELTSKLLKILPLLYLKAQMVSSIAPSDEVEADHYVTEEDYNFVRFALSDLYGSDDAYMEVFVEDMRYSDTPITCFISEGLADIYQQLKDMAANYQTEIDELMENSVSVCLQDFHTHWGQLLLNVMRALHALEEGVRSEE